MKKTTLAGLALAFSTFAALPALSAENDNQGFYVTGDLYNEAMRNTGCDPMPERYPWEWGVAREDQPYSDAERGARSSFVWYCKQNAVLFDDLIGAEETSIAELLASNPKKAVFGLRFVPENMRAERNEMARETAIEMARYALDFAFEGRLGAHRDMPYFYRELSGALNDIEAANGDVRKLDAAHKRAYNVRINLEKRGFYYSYVQAAQAVAMAGNVGVPSEGEYSRDDVAWLALRDAYEAMESTILHRKNYDERHVARAMAADKTRELLGARLSPR